MFIEKVRRTIKKYRMLDKHDKVLAGLSGGPDSVVLLHVLLQLKKEYGLDIHAAHLDHGFRGEESREDRRFCERLAKKMKLDITCKEVDVPTIARQKEISLEEAARLERYDFFRQVCSKKNIRKIAVGHNKDDQAETVLMRVIRGSGMTGLGGISPVRDLAGLTIIRPLIETTRREIEGFTKENNLSFRHDSSNDKLIFTRNRVRQELIPYLEKNFNPNIKEGLANMAENLRLENEFLEKFAKRKFKGMSRVKTNELAIDIKKFKKQPEAMRKRILRSALACLNGNLRRFTYQHWKEMEELIDKRPGNSIVDLPGGINVIKNKTSLIVQKEAGRE